MEHPGIRIRDQIIPKGMTVAKAAKILGVSRPTLSNLLNGNAALSADMAAKLEKAFGEKRENLLKLQAEYDAYLAQTIAAPTTTQRYVVPFLGITSTQIEEWATKHIQARSRLAVLLRILINSTTNGITKIDFPGNDDSQKAGWDGRLEATEATQWVPLGNSGWEFGVTSTIKAKADDDFAKSTKATPKEERLKTTFVFVTPRKWNNKSDWIKTAKAKKQWANVIAYDASDLEQWIEQTIAGQVWFANETELAADGIRTLERCWRDWSEVSVPPLTQQLLLPAINETRATFESRFSKSPEGLTLVTADSTDEGLAFIAQIFSELGGETLQVFRDRVLVLDKPGVLPKILQGTQDFIAVTTNRQVEREMASITRKLHCIAVYPRNQINEESQIILKPIDHESFRKSLEEMGKTGDEISRLANESGNSLTVLRRRLASVPAIKQPEWAADAQVSRKLIPLAFVGAWNSVNEADQMAMVLITDAKNYAQVEQDVQSLQLLNDTPVWAVGKFRGAVSKIDALYATARYITKQDLERCFSLARLVLSEDDPALDLPETDRWAASMHGKSREFSSAFRKGVAETFVFLAVHGNGLFKQGLGIDVEHQAARIIRELIGDPIELRKLESADRDLPTYAEAAPDTFLTLLENDLNSGQSEVLKLIRPATSDHFGGRVSRSGLLWALEGLCWNPKTLLRAVLLLARMSEIELNDNWMNKPINSLIAVFRAWMPQTGADLNTRIAVAKQICIRFPKIGWQLCMSQFGSSHEIGHYSHKPTWRNDGFGFGEPLKKWEPILNFRRDMVELALAWPTYSASMVCDLISHLHDLDASYQEKVWLLVNEWAKGEVSDEHKAEIRDKIRTTVLSRRAAKQLEKNVTAAVLTKTAKSAYKLLTPTNVVWTHAWLFKKSWVDESADDIYGNDPTDYKKREERIQAQRTHALQEIYNQQGFEGVVAIASMGEASWQVGWLAATGAIPLEDRTSFLKAVVNLILEDESKAALKVLCRALLRAIQDDKQRETSILEVCHEMAEDQVVEVMKMAPFRRTTWLMVDALSTGAQQRYWSEVNPDWLHDSPDEARIAVQKLLGANRPKAAFSCVNHVLETIAPNLLYELLSSVAAGGDEPAGHYQLEAYHIQTAMAQVSVSADLTMEQKATLEFKYLEVLSRKWGARGENGIPNLEKYIEQHPELYVQAIVWSFRRKDEAQDPPEFQTPGQQPGQMAERGYKLLHSLERVPGHNHDGILTRDSLLKWISTVREQCNNLGRGDAADSCIGELLSSAPPDPDGNWPCKPVLDTLEELHSEKIMSGTQIGLFNSRGVHSRGKGGAQERDLANKYRSWANAVEHTHPFVHSKLLMEMVRRYEYDAEQEDLEEDIRLRLQ